MGRAMKAEMAPIVTSTAKRKKKVAAACARARAPRPVMLLVQTGRIRPGCTSHLGGRSAGRQQPHPVYSRGTKRGGGRACLVLAGVPVAVALEHIGQADEAEAARAAEEQEDHLSTGGGTRRVRLVREEG